MAKFRVAHMLATLALSQVVGCASIVTGHNQSISVETTHHNGIKVADASCRLTNDKGTWFVHTPGSVTVRRSYAAMQVRCEKDGYTPTSMSAPSHTKAMVAGNILFGGLIGGAVDVASGAAYDYPDLIQVDLVAP